MRRKEKGFGLISLAAAIAIGSLIAAGAGMTCLQIIKGTERNNDRAEVVQQAHNLGRWFSRDAPMAEEISAGNDPETCDDELFTIYWKDWESGEAHYIRYIWLDDIDSLKKIKRNRVMRDKEGDVAENVTSLIAFSIYSANLSQQDNTWILNVETHSGDRSSVQEYRTAQRLN